MAFEFYPLFLPLAITAFGDPEGYFSLAIIAFGAFQFIVPKYPKYYYSPFFARQKKRIFLFLLWGDLVQNRPQNPAPGGCLFSMRKSRSEVPEREDFGEENCLGKGGADRVKKGKKDAQKKVGLSLKTNGI